MATTSLLKPGDRLGKYEILRPLGKGGMAEVYEATDTQFGRKVALKVLPPVFAANQDAVERFQREVRQAAKLDHRSIVTVYDGGEDRGLLYFSMRLLSKGDLVDRIERGMSALETLAVLREVTDALGHAHAAGLIHRDIKPANILFDDRGTPVVTDFGIAKAAIDSKMTRTGTLVGTPRYMSPEQFKGGAIDILSDFYSLGVVAFEMFAGYAPYDAEQVWVLMNMHLNEPVPALPTHAARYQPLIERMMSKDPAGRPQAASELHELIDALLRDPDPQDRHLSDGLRQAVASSDPASPSPLVSTSGVGPMVDSVLRRAGLQSSAPRQVPIGHDTPTLMDPVEPDAPEVLNHQPTLAARARIGRARVLGVIALLGGALALAGAFVFLRSPTPPPVAMPTKNYSPGGNEIMVPADAAPEVGSEEKERRLQAEAKALQRAEEDRKRKEQETIAAQKAEEERKQRDRLDAARKAEDERKRIEATAAAALKAEEERKAQDAADATRKAEADRKRLDDEAALTREAEQTRKRQEQAAIAKKAQDEEQERKRQIDTIAAQKAEEERKRTERMNRPMF